MIVGIFFWQKLKYADSSGHHPAIAAGPECFPSGRRFFIEEVFVPVKEMLFLIVQEVVRIPKHGIEKVEVLCFTGSGSESGEHRRSHEQRIAPPPVFATRTRI